MIWNGRGVHQLETYIATQTKGPYLDCDVRGKTGGFISACYWLDSGVFFKSTTSYERMDDGMFLFDNLLRCEEIRVHGLRERILHGDTEWRFTNDPQTPATDSRINISFASRFVRNFQGFQATPFTAHDVSRYLDNLGSPSVYSILPDRIAVNPDVGYRAYRTMSIIISSQHMEECEQGLQQSCSMMAAEKRFLDSHLEKAYSIGMNRHFTDGQLTVFALRHALEMEYPHMLDNYLCQYEKFTPERKEQQREAYEFCRYTRKQCDAPQPGLPRIGR